MPAKHRTAEPVRPSFLDRWERKIQKVLSHSLSAPPVPYGSLLYSYPMLHAQLRKLGTLDELRDHAGFDTTDGESLLGLLPKNVIRSRADYVSRVHSLFYGPATDQQMELFNLTGEIQRQLLKCDVSKRVEYLNQGRRRTVSRMTDVEKVQVIIERLFLICYNAGNIVEEHRAVRLSWNGARRKLILKEQRTSLSPANLSLSCKSFPQELVPRIERWRDDTTAFFRELRQSMAPFLKRRETTVLLDAGIAVMKELGPFYGRKSKAKTASLLLHAFHPDLWSCEYDSLKNAYLSKSRKPLRVF